MREGMGRRSETGGPPDRFSFVRSFIHWKVGAHRPWMSIDASISYYARTAAPSRFAALTSFDALSAKGASPTAAAPPPLILPTGLRLLLSW